MPASAEDTQDDPMAQIARLREQVETLMRDTMTSTLGPSTAGRVEAAAHDAADEARIQADKLAGMVRERPLTAILITALLGFLLGRALR